MFISFFFFFFNDTATTEIYTLSLHDALPIAHAPAWALILAWAGLDSDMQEILEDSPAAPRSADDYLALARTQAPGHPLLDLIHGCPLAKHRQWDQPLPLLAPRLTAPPRHPN